MSSRASNRLPCLTVAPASVAHFSVVLYYDDFITHMYLNVQHTLPTFSGPVHNVRIL